MRKVKIIRIMSLKTGHNREECIVAFDAFVRIALETLSCGDTFPMAGLGRLKVVNSQATMRIMPNKKVVRVRSKRRVRFVPAKELRTL